MTETTQEPEPSPAPVSSGGASSIRPGYSLPLPENVPRPTPWPASAALGVMLVGWGILMSFAIFLIGAALLTTSLVGWIGEIRYERNRA
jgi:hypothetical protein